jgi:hypothetical protein
MVVQVDPTKLPCLVQWKREFTMETILIELRRYGRIPPCEVAFPLTVSI